MVAKGIYKIKKGFTLLELLLTMVLFSSGVVALAWAISAGVSASIHIEGMDLALNIAQSAMEEAKNKSFTTLVSEGSTGPTADPDFSDYDITFNIASGNDPMRIDVIVTWDVKGGENSVTLTSLVTDI